MTQPQSKSLSLTLPSDLEIRMSRVFDYPRALVYRAMTDPEALPKWWGPRQYTTIVDKLDPRPGGVWRFVQRGPDGDEYAFNGVYREIVPPEKLVFTFEWEGLPGHVLTETILFEEQGGKTTVTATMVFDSVEDRDGMLQSGMEEGAADSYDRVEELLAMMA
jgi:uncharacterized protein YndB with AHSA1/START domain